ncbi:carbohydrate ABC transporter permease [Pseudooceanicola sediminis]|uniref:Carbohydrate ABC transporter permease n=1 Tax=Pseudooceanicola sediminis TaxID=2211117 RepID=A0A399J6X2_9RHOB|nr:carbohydrate ABC transporter permease [Pseudooceanicola sediminis]KAA2315497.1 carbohydrate ABC transporter permease [Puniceibacterium sp. HSS470]RII40297.1 carbohydrate ABC transporter permease [Pseudooceanicola sediminis]|tara:strand:+ start:108591 stop:109796 length:1206 start_codon:yes stop_codon:yes gene_type:complete
MKSLRTGYITGAALGVLWSFTMAVTVAVAMSFATGDGFRPGTLGIVLSGLLCGALSARVGRWVAPVAGVVIYAVLTAVGLPPVVAEGGMLHVVLSAVIGGAVVGLGMWAISGDLPPGALTRHEFEASIIRFLTGFGYVFFTAIVVIPFYVMVMTSLKSQQALLQNPLDFSLDLSRGWDLLRSYRELLTDYNFGQYLWTSFFISVLTVLITLAFSIPGAYAVARLRFRGRAAMSRSVLLIYMVPMIVLALPIYIGFSMAGLRNTVFGIIVIYPVTTIPVALYMLQGYFRGLPAEVEEAGLMDGLSRLAVIWKITLPLSLPALASVSLYVFMIAWNEFLLAFMLLDDPSKFTLTRGIASLNSSEIPRQHLMAGAVIATVPIMGLFLGLERFMTRGLTAGSVKG